jgi:site-specific recombinase XerD
MSNRTKVLLRKEQMEVTLPILVEYYVTSRQVKGCSKKTLICLRSNINKFIRYLAKHDHSLKLSDLTLHDAREYVASLQGTVTKYEGHTLTPPHPNSTFAPETVHTHVRALRGFSTWLQHEAYTKKPIFELLELPKLPKKKIDVLSPEEIQKILDCINPGTFKGARLYAMILLMLDTGIRAGELVGMKLAEVDWNRGVFKVFGKGAKERFVPLGATAKQALLRYVQVFRPKPARDDVDQVFLSLDGYPLTVNALVRIMHRLGKNSGVPRLHAHLLRHTCGVQYLVVGGDTKSLQMFLGHASPFMTNHYEQFKDEHVMAQHRKFSPVDAMGITYRRYGNRKASPPKQNRSNGQGQ